jgi:hypothetical protein
MFAGRAPGRPGQPSPLAACIAALAVWPDLARHSGRALVGAALAGQLGVVDIDGRRPRPLRLEDV